VQGLSSINKQYEKIFPQDDTRLKSLARVKDHGTKNKLLFFTASYRMSA
jgi:hypothetical protein